MNFPKLDGAEGHDGARIPPIHPVRKRGSQLWERRSLGLKEQETIKSYDRPSQPPLNFLRSDADPVDFTLKIVRRGLRAYAADADDRAKRALPYTSHAVPDSEASETIRVTGMGALIDENSH